MEKQKKKHQSSEINIDIWINHISHLTLGMRFQKECRVCNISIKENNTSVVGSSLKEDVTFHNNAILSGRKSINF